MHRQGALDDLHPFDLVEGQLAQVDIAVHAPDHRDTVQQDLDALSVLSLQAEGAAQDHVLPDPNAAIIGQYLVEGGRKAAVDGLAVQYPDGMDGRADIGGRVLGGDHDVLEIQVPGDAVRQGLCSHNTGQEAEQDGQTAHGGILLD